MHWLLQRFILSWKRKIIHKKADEAIMRKSYIKIGAFMATIALLLTGCGAQLPDMTEEEEQIVGEYAAKLLLKYDANNRSRLVSREEVEEWESEEEQKAENKIPEPTHEGMGPVEDTPVIEIGQETAGGATTGTIEEFYELAEGIQIAYLGNELCDSYSQNGDANDYFALDAADGKKLLVLKFRIENHSQTEQRLDMLSQSAKIRVTVDGSDYNVLMTMLMDDLSTYVGNIPVDGTVDAVLLAELSDEMRDDISSLSLNLKNESKMCTICLQ